MTEESLIAEDNPEILERAIRESRELEDLYRLPEIISFAQFKRRFNVTKVITNGQDRYFISRRDRPCEAEISKAANASDVERQLRESYTSYIILYHKSRSFASNVIYIDSRSRQTTYSIGSY